MSQSLRNSADKLAKEMAKAIDLDTMVGALGLVIGTEPDKIVMALSTMDSTVTKQMIVLAMTMVIIAKTEETV